MTFQDIVNLVVSNGIGVACIIYFMWRDAKFMNTLQTTLTELVETMDLVKEILLNAKGEKKNGT